MSAESKTTFLLVPGSFATVESYDKLTPLITKAGYQYKLIPLLSANDGSRLPAPTMQDDAAHIRKEVQQTLDEGQNVVLVLHSYSGVPGSEALKGLGRADRPDAPAVIGIVYVTSILPLVGQSLQDIMSAYIPEDMKTSVPGDYMPFDAKLVPAIFSDLTDPVEVERYGKTMVVHSSETFRAKLGYAAWKDIPSLYLSGGKDAIVPVDVQNNMVENANDDGGKVTKMIWEESGHCPMISMPDLVVEQLIRASKF